jgi:hypothetical protein
MEASQHSLLAACFTLHSTNTTLATVPQRGAGLWINSYVTIYAFFNKRFRSLGTNSRKVLTMRSFEFKIVYPTQTL